MGNIGGSMEEEKVLEDNNQESQEVEKEQQQEQQQEVEKKYTDEDVDRLINQKYAKLKADAEKEVEQAKKEDEKLASMNAKEKLEHEKKKLEEELETLRREKNRNEMKDVAVNMLGEKNITLGNDLVNILVTDEAETTKDNVENFIGLFNTAVDKEVTERLKSPTPKRMGGGKMTKKDILDIKDPILRRQKIAENLELFD